jgi:hypothetical protein
MHPEGKSARLRRTGRLLLLAGVMAAVIVYVMNVRTVVRGLDDSNALGYTRAMNSAMAREMGHFGIMMMGWNDSLTSPAGKALGVAAVFGLFAGYFYRVAWVIDEEDREERESVR